MKGKTFLILLVAAGILVTASLLYVGKDKNNGTTELGSRLFVDLPVNDVTKITIKDAQNQVTLAKGQSIWQVEERNGYPADFDELTDTVVKLSRLKIGRSFTGSPDSLTRLSLMPPAANQETGQGTRITLSDTTGETVADVILGQTRKSEGGTDGGQYIKKTDNDTVFLVDGSFPFLKKEPQQWLKKEIINIKAEDIQSVACFSAGDSKPLYTLTRPEKGQAPQLDSVPDGRSVDPSKIDQVFDAIGPLTLDDVEAGDQLSAASSQDKQHLTYQLYDGRRFTFILDTDQGDRHTIRLIAAQTAEPEVAPQDDQAKSESVDQDSTEEEVADTSDPKTGPMRSVEEINEELGPWVFSIKKWQFDSFITQPEALLEEVKQEGDSTS